MNHVSFMEKLLDGADVEVRPLGDVAEIKRGTSITQKNVTPGEIPVIAGGRTPAYFHNLSNRTGQTIVIAGSGAYAGFVSWWEQPIFVSDAFTVKPYAALLPKYCFYWLQGMQQQLHELKSGGGVPHVYPRDVAPFLIPVPCPENPEKSLEIQAEIVRILDTFTEINLDYILELIFENNKNRKDKETLVEDVRRIIRSSIGNRAKESLLVDFINQTDLDTIQDKASIIDAFFSFAQAEQQREVVELIIDENLNEEAAKRYITASLKREFASENGTELNAILPKMSPLNPQYLTKKQSVFQKIVAFVEKFKGVGGKV